MKNRNIKAYDINFLSLEEGFIFWQNSVRKYLLLALDQSYVDFVSSPSGKGTAHEPPPPLGNFWVKPPPLPLGISSDHPWGDMDFSGTTQP